MATMSPESVCWTSPSLVAPAASNRARTVRDVVRAKRDVEQERVHRPVVGDGDVSVSIDLEHDRATVVREEVAERRFVAGRA